MRDILIASILLIAAGCVNFTGPFAADTRRVDDPCYTIAEQQRWGRSRLSLPEESWMVPSGVSRPGNWGTPTN